MNNIRAPQHEWGSPLHFKSSFVTFNIVSQFSSFGLLVFLLISFDMIFFGGIIDIYSFCFLFG